MRKVAVQSGGIQQMVSERLCARSGSRVKLRMTPMIDVIFLLLIFFLVTANFRPDEGFLPIRLPTAQADSIVLGRAEPLVVGVFASQDGCRVQIGSAAAVQIQNQTQDVDFTTLAQQIFDVISAQKRTTSDPVEIVCQSQVEWQHLVKVYNILFGMGVSDITFCMTGRDDGRIE